MAAYFCGSSPGNCSGSGRAAAIRAWLRATAAASAESSSKSVVVEPLRPASRLVIETATVRAMPAVVMSLAANRVWPSSASASATSHSSALENPRIRSARARASVSVQLISRGPQDGDPAEPRRRAAVAHGVELRRLPLAIGVQADILPRSIAANPVARSPEVGRAALIGDVGDHPANLAPLDR